MINTVRLFYNTGFDNENIPESPDVLLTAPYIDIPGHWDLQDFFLTTLRLKTTWSEIENADYLKFGDAYYFIENIKMVNMNMAIISLKLDAITSIGGAVNLDYVGGYIERATVINDDFRPGLSTGLSLNTMNEPITPQHPLMAQLQSHDDSGELFQNVRPLIASTVDLNRINATLDNGFISNSHAKAMTFESDIVDSETGEPIRVVIPSVPALSNSTFFSVGTSVQKGIGNIGMYLADEQQIQNAMAYVTALNLTGSLLYYYAPIISNGPAGYGKGEVGVSPGQFGNWVKYINGGYVRKSVYLEATSRYMKSRFMYRKYLLTNTVSGNSREFDAYDVCNIINDDIMFTYIFEFDPQPDGRIYLRPARFQSADTLSANHLAVAGPQWPKQPVTTNTSGTLLADNNYGMQVQSYITQYDYGMAQWNTRAFDIARQSVGFLGDTMNIGDPATLGHAVGSGVDLALNMYETSKAAEAWDREQSISKNKIKLDKAMSRIQTPNLSCAATTGLSIYTDKNQFAIYEVGPNASDIARFDRFFDLYGYAMDTGFDKIYMTDTSGPGPNEFNYIQTRDLKIDKKHGNIRTRKLAENQINGGVRIWHQLVKPI